MSEECNHDCESCASRCENPTPDFSAPANSDSNIKHVIGVVSGKGGVGKSSVSALLAVTFARLGYKTAILDADVTGPSIPRMFGLRPGSVEPTPDGKGMFATESAGGTKIMSVNLLLQDEETPVIWRGPVIAGTVKQFWTDTVWGDIDYMFVDMPPGTGDVPLTVFQSLPLDGVVIVSTPQQLVSMIVTKAAKMAEMMNIPVLGIIENMSYITCPDCGKQIPVFAKEDSDADKKLGIPLLAKLPVDTDISLLCDRGLIEMVNSDYLADAADEIIKLSEKDK